MRLADIQKEKLLETLHIEALNRGITLNPFDIDHILNVIYDEPGRSAGMPLTSPVIQNAREHFDVGKYNLFISQVSQDIDVLFSFFKRNRLRSRNHLVFNDVEMRRMLNTLRRISDEADGFFKLAEGESDKSNTALKLLTFRDAEYTNVPGESDLLVDSDNGVITLNVKPDQSRDLDLTYLEDINDAVTTIIQSNKVTRTRELNSLVNLTSTDASQWSYEVDALGDVTEASIRIDIPLQNLEEINKVALAPIPGSSYEVVIEKASANNSFTPIGRTDNLNQKKVFYFTPDTVDRIRITLKTTRNTTDDNSTSQFVFGLTSLQIGRTVFDSKGSILLREVDPNVGERPILSVSMKASEVLPLNTESRYFISTNSEEDRTNPDIRISGAKTDDETIEFSIAQELAAPRSQVTRPVDPTLSRNAVDFYELSFTGVPALDIEVHTYLPHLTDLWLGQNIFKESDFPDFQKEDKQDAVVVFGSVNTFASIRVPMSQYNLPLYKDAVGSYIRLPLPLAFPSMYGQAVTDDTDVKSLMKTSDFGVFKLQYYKSSTPENPTIINSRILSNFADPHKVYVSGSYAFDDVFYIDYLAVVDNNVVLTKGSLKLHDGIGSEGRKDENQIKLSEGKYQVNYDSNQMFAMDSGILGRKYLNFQGLFDVTRLKVYETYMYVDESHVVINLDQQILVDQEAGEYVILKHEKSKENLRLDNVSEIRGLKAGWYLVSIVSKPFSSHPSAIKSMLSVKDVPGITGVSPTRIFSLDSSRYISRLGVANKPHTYQDKEKLFNESKRVGSNLFTHIVEDNTIKFIAPKDGVSYLFANSVDDYGVLRNGFEMASLVLTYFPTNLFKDNVHSRINIKMDLENLLGASSVLETPVVEDLELTFKYL